MDVLVDVSILVYIMPRVNWNEFLFLWYATGLSARIFSFPAGFDPHRGRHHLVTTSPFAEKFATVRPYAKCPPRIPPAHQERPANYPTEALLRAATCGHIARGKKSQPRVQVKSAVHDA
jgi:hypothetical protein